MATQTALQRAYRALQKEKSRYCDNKSTKTKVKAKAAKYIAAAKKKGQTQKEAQAKANRVMNGGCSMSSRVSGTKKRTAKRKPAKRKTTARRRTR
jgi:hypothetical protein